MTRAGAVGAAEVGTNRWYRLVVFDDGWVDIPTMGRRLAHARSDLRRAVLQLVLLLAVLGGAVLVLQTWPGAAPLVGVLVLLAIVAGLVTQLRHGRALRRRAAADGAQLRADLAQGGAVRRRPGAPLLRRASSARELASWLTGVRLTERADVVGTTTDADDGRHDDRYLVRLRLADGTTRAYASPDPALLRLLDAIG